MTNRGWSGSWVALVVMASLWAGAGATAASAQPVRLVSGLQGGSGSTVGPDGAIYVTESLAGSIRRVDPQTGATEVFAAGLPPALIGIGGAMDVAFVGHKAFVLVTLVADDVGGNRAVGIYRMEGPSSWSLLADIGTFARANPPDTPFDLPTGVQYAMQFHEGAFLVTDGHHNRVLRVTLDGRIGVAAAFGNIVPTGLAARHQYLVLGLAGPTPHLPEDGEAILLDPQPLQGALVGTGTPLLVDVEFGADGALYALGQGQFPVGAPPGAPALPNTGVLTTLRPGGRFELVVGGLNLPTSLEVIGGTAYVVTLGGEIWTVTLG